MSDCLMAMKCLTRFPFCAVCKARAEAERTQKCGTAADAPPWDSVEVVWRATKRGSGASDD